MAGPFGDPAIAVPPAVSESSGAIARRSTGCGLHAPKYDIGILHMTKLRTTPPDQIWNDDRPTSSNPSGGLIDAAESTVQPRWLCEFTACRCPTIDPARGRHWAHVFSTPPGSTSTD